MRFFFLMPQPSDLLTAVCILKAQGKNVYFPSPKEAKGYLLLGALLSIKHAVITAKPFLLRGHKIGSHDISTGLDLILSLVVCLFFPPQEARHQRNKEPNCPRKVED